MHSLRKYIQLHKETIIVILVLTFLSIFAISTYFEKNNLFSFVYMIFVIVSAIKIVFNKINA